jgi:uncharacterized membrane protein YeaQ/YmgE (transglycosylase-associated protein family)
MGILAFIVVGLIAGLLARLVMPGRGPLGLIVTALMGIAGAFVGGFLVQLLGGAGVTTLGAVVLLAIYRLFAGGRTV